MKHRSPMLASGVGMIRFFSHPHMSCGFKQFPPAEESPGTDSTIIKLIKSDGTLRIYRQPIYISELMLEFPEHAVCASDSFYIGQKILALPGHDRLQLGCSYLLFPKHLCESVLSFVTIASFTATKAAAAASCRPFDIEKTPSGCLRIRISEEFIMSQLIEDLEVKIKDENAIKGLITTPQLEKEYRQLFYSQSRKWKPKLETIRENGHDHKLIRNLSFLAKQTGRQSRQTATQRSGSARHHKSR